MAYPFFYEPAYAGGQEPFRLSEDTAHHVATVLRMRTGESLYLTNGKGSRVLVTLESVDKKKAWVRAAGPEPAGVPAAAPVPLIIGVSLLKNSARFEWMLEKCTEIGATAMLPLLCARTERQHFRPDRMRQLIVSAMLQSQQVWLPEMPDPLPLAEAVGQPFEGRSYIAHCLPGQKQRLRQHPEQVPARILIGPEGDFTPDEIAHAQAQGWMPVELGETRLRTETAAMVAAAILRDAMQSRH